MIIIARLTDSDDVISDFSAFRAAFRTPAPPFIKKRAYSVFFMPIASVGSVRITNVVKSCVNGQLCPIADYSYFVRATSFELSEVRGLVQRQQNRGAPAAIVMTTRTPHDCFRPLSIS